MTFGTIDQTQIQLKLLFKKLSVNYIQIRIKSCKKVNKFILTGKMNQIQLFHQDRKGPMLQRTIQQQKSPSKIQSHRPGNINVTKIFSDNHKWRECKIIGKNISIRSYSACCAFQNKLYVYGGYQILNGSLGDFYSIDLHDNQPKFHWVEIKGKNGIHPGPRSKHALIGGKEKIYLIGGLYQDVHSSNDIYEFDPTTENWTKLHPKGIQNIPKIDSFGCVLIQNQHAEQSIYIIGGYNDQKAQMSNAIYSFTPSKNTVSVIFENNPNDQKSMPPLSGIACTTDGNNVYIFGGKNQENRFNDLWMFNLKNLSYEMLPPNGDVPAVRNGHTMTYYKDRLFVFGGIHDITWELDDLHIYNLSKKSWTTLQQDSPRKLSKKPSPQEKKNDKSLQKRQNKKKTYYETVGGLVNGIKNNSTSPMSNSAKQKLFSTLNQNDESGNPGKMIDEQRKKVFYQKKAEMLKNFEIDEKEKEKYILLETASQAMKNSLDVIGNPSGKPNPDRLTDFGKETQSKFLAPLENDSNLVIGKKPCARDGHCSVMLNEQLIIFGGDRHQMSFNDIYKLNFNLAQKEIEKNHSN